MISAMIFKVLGLGSLEEVKNTIQTHGVRNVTVDDSEWPSHEILVRHTRMVGTPDVINKVTLPPNAQGEFILAHAYSERTKRKQNWLDDHGTLLPKDERVNTAEADLVFFSHNGLVFLAFLTHQLKHINSIIKEVLIGEHWGEVIPAIDFAIPDDFFYWIVHRFTEENGKVEKGLEIAGIQAYLGLLTEETHTMSGSGPQVSGLLGTMAFLFTNEHLDSLQSSVRYLTEYVSFRLYRNGNTKIDENEYLGSFCGNYDGKARHARLCYLTYASIIPVLITAYEKYKSDGKWSEHRRQKFVSDTGYRIMQRVVKPLGLPRTCTVGDILDHNPNGLIKVADNSDETD